ncbi:MAG: RHS repeat protein, partial [Candidatus Schekmanbacteria bacterium]|nr:RHS repeat protein [Candidatus Schekmanbacteria bacterium]
DAQGGAFALAYDTSGNRARLTYPNGVTTRYAYDAQNRLVELSTTRTDESVVQRHAFTLGPAVALHAQGQRFPASVARPLSANRQKSAAPSPRMITVSALSPVWARGLSPCSRKAFLAAIPRATRSGRGHATQHGQVYRSTTADFPADSAHAHRHGRDHCGDEDDEGPAPGIYMTGDRQSWLQRPSWRQDPTSKRSFPGTWWKTGSWMSRSRRTSARTSRTSACRAR